MKAVTFHRHGGPEELCVEQVPDPEIGPGEVLIRVKACALNHLDIWIRRGIPNYHVPLPHISGSDVSGVIEQLNDGGGSSLSIGQRVFVSPGLSCWRCPECFGGRENLCQEFHVLGAKVKGGYAEYVKVAVINVMPIPGDLTFEQAAAFPLVSVTAWHMIFGLAELRPGETMLVVGAGSGVGSLAVQLGKLVGAQVITTVGTEEKMEKARNLGADLVINHSVDSIQKHIEEYTSGRGVDVVIEHVGDQVWDQCIRSLSRGGRLVTCGATTGAQAHVDTRFLFMRQLKSRLWGRIWERGLKCVRLRL